ELRAARSADVSSVPTSMTTRSPSPGPAPCALGISRPASGRRASRITLAPAPSYVITARMLPRLHDFLDVRPLLEEDLGPAPLALDADGVDVRANRLLAHPALVHQDASSGPFCSASPCAGT